MAADANRLAAALDYLERIKRQAVDFGGGVASNLAERAKSAGGLAFEALTSDPNIGRMTTAEFSQAAADRQTPRLDQAAQDLGTISRAIVTRPIQTAKAIVQGEIERAQGAMQSPRAAGEYAGSFIDPARMAAALRKTGPVMAELDVYHGTPHRFPATEANPLGEFDASKIGTGEGAQAFGHGIYYAENPGVAKSYQFVNAKIDPDAVTYNGKSMQNLYDAAIRKQTAAHRLKDEKSIQKANAELAFWEQMMVRNHPDQVIADVMANPEDWPEYTQFVKGLDRAKFKNVEQAGNLYKADLPDEMIGRMLDWDKPFLDQSQEIKDLARNLLPPAVYNQLLTQRSGDFVEELAKYKGGKAKASELMRQANIPGIKYLDAGSRGQGGSGTRNFVVFPGEEKKVRILERDGKKVADMLQRAAPTSAQVEVDIYPLRSDPNTLYLSKIAVPKDQQGQGLGSQAMQEIIDKADAEGKRVVLSPSTEYGASSVGRLKDFYKRFGFVENKGRNKNYAISETMYRDPQKAK